MLTGSRASLGHVVGQRENGLEHLLAKGFAKSETSAQGHDAPVRFGQTPDIDVRDSNSDHIAGASITVNSAPVTCSIVGPVMVRNSKLTSAFSPGKRTGFLVEAVAFPSSALSGP